MALMCSVYGDGQHRYERYGDVMRCACGSTVMPSW